VPPDTVSVAVPSLPPLHDTPDACVNVADSASAGCVMVTVAVVLQLLASVIVMLLLLPAVRAITVCAPLARFEPDELSPVTLYEYTAVPPEIVSVA
jgi:hypothetical protein